MDKDIGIQILDKIIDYIESPTEGKIQSIVDTLIQFGAHIEIVPTQDEYRFKLTRNRFFLAETLDIPTYHLLAPLVDVYKLRNRNGLEKFLEVLTDAR